MTGKLDDALALSPSRVVLATAVSAAARAVVTEGNDMDSQASARMDAPGMESAV